MRSLDLNLLRPLRALLEERSVTKAAETLELSQPAMSAALARLRRHFDDELLARAGRSYELTPFAHSLLPLVGAAVHGVESALEARKSFDPASSERSFEIAASDYSAVMLIEPLRRILAQEAPGVSVSFASIGSQHTDLSALSKVDLLVGPMGYSLPGQSRQLFRDAFVAVVDSRHPVLLEQYPKVQSLAALPHAVGRFGESITTPVDRLLEALESPRTASAQVGGLVALTLLVEGTDLVAFVPRMLAMKAGRGGGIAILDFPVELEAVLVESMYWHPSRAEDPATLWLRDTLKRAAGQLHQIYAESPILTRKLGY